MTRWPSRGREGTSRRTSDEPRRGGRRNDAARVGPAPPSLNIAELESRKREDLIDFAAESGVDNAAAMQTPELIFRILKRQAERNGNIFSGGVLAVLDDGFGFLRGDRLIPGPNDVYISQSQIRRFGLRSGDYVTGQVRQPKDSEKYYGLLRVEAVNGIDPEEAKRRGACPGFPDSSGVEITRHQCQW